MWNVQFKLYIYTKYVNITILYWEKIMLNLNVIIEIVLSKNEDW